MNHGGTSAYKFRAGPGSPVVRYTPTTPDTPASRRHAPDTATCGCGCLGGAAFLLAVLAGIVAAYKWSNTLLDWLSN